MEDGHKNTSPHQSTPTNVEGFNKNPEGILVKDYEFVKPQFDESDIDSSLHESTPILHHDFDMNPEITLEQVIEDIIEKQSTDFTKLYNDDNDVVLNKKNVDESVGEAQFSDSQFTFPDEMKKLIQKYTFMKQHLEKGKGELDLRDSQVTLPGELLPSLNAYVNLERTIIVHPSANKEQTPMNVSRVRRPSKFKESPFTIKFGSAEGSTEVQTKKFNLKHPFASHPIYDIEDTKVTNKFLAWLSVDLLKYHAKKSNREEHYKKNKSRMSVMNFGILSVDDKNWFYIMGTPGQSWSDEQIDVCLYYLRKKSKYEPNSSYSYSTVDCNFMNIVSNVLAVYSIDDPTLDAGGKEYHLNEYISGFCMHATVPWHMVDHIFIPINVKFKHHWVLSVLSFNQRCIYVYDSMSSAGHDSAVLAEVQKLAEVIPLFLLACKFYEKKGIDIDSHPNYKLNEKNDLFDVYVVEDLPQQPSGSLDCGLYMITYAEYLTFSGGISKVNFDPDLLRTRYPAMLWHYGIRKEEEKAQSDDKAPSRPHREI
ncbi:hypothetical protein CQW23_15112 [Capsicum baccatum]|uniref:Ubiquitin-like protease family profile domain-containing protein n=1 Tax=Capsicum baccatum TaxID=33114 RepID=A0A2G2WL35_CAPBA|nr:hypothetical protein CQW23_15112 [Capsicum baccatum]